MAQETLEEFTARKRTAGGFSATPEGVVPAVEQPSGIQNEGLEAFTARKRALGGFRAVAEPVAPSVDPDQSTGLAGDIGREFGVGLNQLATAAGLGLRKVGFEETGAALQEAGRSRTEELISQLTPEQQEARSLSLFDDGFSGRKLAGTIAQSAPSILAGVGAGALAIRGLTAAGLSTVPAGILGAGIGEGSVGAGLSFADVHDQITQLPAEQLEVSELFLEALDSTTEGTPEERRAAAREKVATSQALKAAGLIGLATTILGAPSGVALAKIFGGETGKTFIATAIRQAGLESLQEAPQSAAETFIAGELLGDIDPSLRATPKQILEAGVEGALAGAALGGPIGAVAQGVTKLDQRRIGVDPVDLKVRGQILLAHKQGNPDFDLDGPDAKAFLAQSLNLVEGEFVPAPTEVAPVEEVPAVEPEAVAPAVEPEAEVPAVEPPEVEPIEGQPVPVPEPLPEEAPAPTTEFETEEAAQTFFESLPEGVTKRLTKVGDKFIVGTGTEGVQEVGTEREELNALVQKQINITPETEFTDRERQLQETHSRFITGRLAVEARRAEVAPEVAPTPELVLRANGAPFATETSALRSQTGKRLAETHDIVPVEGGVAFQPKAEVAPEAPEVAAPEVAEGVTQEVQAETVPVQEQQVFRANGKPFASEASALRSATGKRLADTHEIVQVEGGVVFQPKPEFRRGVDPIQDLHTGLSSYLRTSVPQGTFTQAPAPKGQEALYSSLEKLLGKKIVFFKAKNPPMKFEGVTNISPDTIFVNVDSKTPHLVVTGHEFLHEYGRDSRVEYTEMKKTILGMIPKDVLDAQVAKLTRAKSREGQAPTRESVIREAEDEIVADYFGDQFTKKEFWKKVEARNPEGFAKFVQGFIDFIEKVKGQFSGPQVTDIQKAQDVAAEALASFVRRNPEAAVKAAEVDSTLTARRFDEVAKKNISLVTAALKARTFQPGVLKNVLLVAPESEIVTRFSKSMPLLKDVEALKRQLTNTSSEISTLFGELAKKMGEKQVIKKFTNAAAVNSTRQIWPQKTLVRQDWVAEGRRQAKETFIKAQEKLLLKKFGTSGKIGTITPTDVAQAEKLAKTAANKAWTAGVKTATEARQLQWAQDAWAKSDLQENFGETFKQGYAAGKAAYDALSPPEQKTYLEAIEQMREIRVREKNGMQAIIEDAMSGDPAQMKVLVDRLNAGFVNLKGAYWPLSRYGDYILNFANKKGSPNVEYFESALKREQRIAELKATGTDPNTITVDYRDENNKQGAAPKENFSVELIAAIEKKEMVGVDQNNSDEVALARERITAITSTINDTWLRMLPETNAGKNSMQRKTTLGWSNDLIRSFLTYGQTHGRKIAQLEVGRKVDKTLSTMAKDLTKRSKAGEDITEERIVLNDQRARLNGSGSEGIGNEFVKAAGKYTVFHFMTSPSVFLVQMGQVAVFTLPKMSVKFGVSTATNALRRGTTKAFKQKYRRKAVLADKKVMKIHEMIGTVVTPEIREVRKDPSLVLGERLFSDAQIEQAIKKEGLSSYQLELLALAESASRNLLDVSIAHEINDWEQGKDPNTPVNRVFNGMMVFMRESEKASRKSAILATYEASTKKGKGFFDTMNDIKEVVDSSLFNPSLDAKGIALRGDTLRVLLQLQTFRIITAFKMIGLFQQSVGAMTAGLTKEGASEVQKAALKEFVGIIGMGGVIAGTSGMLAMPIIFKILNAAFGDDDEPFDSEKEWDQWLTETFGEPTAEVVTGGAFSTLGMSLSRRLGLGDIYGFGTDAPAHLHGRGEADWWLTQMAGPTYAIGSNWWKAYDLITRKGEVNKGLQAALPKPFRDALKAFSLASDGLKAGDKRLLAAEDITVNEIFLTALGIQPLRTSALTEREFKIGAFSTALSSRFSQLVNDFAKAQEDGDADDELEAIQGFMRKHPGFVQNAGGRIRSTLRKAAIGDAGISSRQFLRAEREFDK